MGDTSPKAKRENSRSQQHPTRTRENPLGIGEDIEDGDDQSVESFSNQLVLYNPNKNNTNEDVLEASTQIDVHSSSVQSTLTRNPPRPLMPIGSFTVQCATCFKWRLIPTQTKYEEIRERILQDPFVCDRAREWGPDITCDDPADISQDGSRVWAIDKPNIAQPPTGWERLLRIRGEGSSKFADVYYVAPSGKRLRSTIEVEKYLFEHPEYIRQGVTLSQFSFQTPKPLQENYIRKRPARLTNACAGAGSETELVDGLNIAPRDLALLCQKVENQVVGAPYGVMDQMTSACGEANKLLAMVCQPAEVKELVAIPSHIRFWGFDSGIKHSVGGTDYGSVRIGAFMGRKMIKSLASSLSSDLLTGGTVPQHVDKLNIDEYEEHGMRLLKAEASLDYLCNLSTHRYEGVYAKMLPEYIRGESFLEEYADHNDKVTVVDPKKEYAVRAPTKHPIYKNFRVEAFKSLLTAATTDKQLSSLGELMYQCHYSYNDCGLGSDGTDRLVKLVQEVQHRKSYSGGKSSLFGAKITGGGSGGSVCVMGRNCVLSSQEILEIQQRYKVATHYLPYIFEGSSPGAGKFGYLRLRRRPSTNV